MTSVVAAQYGQQIDGNFLACEAGVVFSAAASREALETSDRFHNVIQQARVMRTNIPKVVDDVSQSSL
jgi:hypothetical protein